MNCILCNGKTKQGEVEYSEYGISFGKFKGFVCMSCNETYFESDIVSEIQKISQAKGLCGLAKKAIVGEVGNSLAIRIPKELVQFFDIKKGQEVLLVPQNKHDRRIEVLDILCYREV